MQNTLIKTLTISTMLASSSLLAGDSIIDSVGLNLGKSYIDFSQSNNNGAILLGNEPDSNFNAVELYTTLNPISNLCKEYGMKPYISYTYAKNSELKHQYLLAGVNKYYSLKDTKLEHYVGVLGGYGQMDWEYDPLNNSNSVNSDANSFVGGLQIGTNYPVTKNYALTINAKYLRHNYDTNLKTTNADAVVEHDSTASLTLGVEYSF